MKQLFSSPAAVRETIMSDIRREREREKTISAEEARKSKRNLFVFSLTHSLLTHCINNGKYESPFPIFNKWERERERERATDLQVCRDVCHLAPNTD